MFEPGKPLPDNTLFICEQMPGLVVSGDVTQELARGYFSSYNVPYVPDIFNYSGYNSLYEKFGARYSYELSPRAQIFRRDENTVVDLETFKTMLRYNDYKNDPVSEGDPTATM